MRKNEKNESFLIKMYKKIKIFLFFNYNQKIMHPSQSFSICVNKSFYCKFFLHFMQ